MSGDTGSNNGIPISSKGHIIFTSSVAIENYLKASLDRTPIPATSEALPAVEIFRDIQEKQTDPYWKNFGDALFKFGEIVYLMSKYANLIKNENDLLFDYDNDSIEHNDLIRKSVDTMTQFICDRENTLVLSDNTWNDFREGAISLIESEAILSDYDSESQRENSESLKVKLARLYFIGRIYKVLVGRYGDRFLSCLSETTPTSTGT